MWIRERWGSGERMGRNGRSRRVWKEEGEKNGM